jgi:hypothetical protein
MPVPTNPRQPVVYDMMLLAHATLRLRDFEARRVAQRHKEYPERKTVFENACTKIRCLGQFISATGGPDLIKVTDPHFGGTADKRFVESYFDVISKYVSHLHEQRYKKEKKYPRPNAADVLKGGREILDYLKPLMDSLKSQLTGDAAHWYRVFEDLYPEVSK